jgi:hypothetical protein
LKDSVRPTETDREKTEHKKLLQRIAALTGVISSENDQAVFPLRGKANSIAL